MCGGGVVILPRECGGFEQIHPTVSTGFTKSMLYNSDGLPAKEVLVSVETFACRFRTDGTAPTASVGMPIASGGSLLVTGINDLLRFRAIDTAAGVSTLNVQYYF